MPSFAQFGNQLYTGERSIDFVGRRRLWYVIAVAAVVLSLLALWLRGLNPSIEFRGGSEFRVSNVSNTSEIVGEDAVSSVHAGAQARVSVVGGNSIRVQTDKLTSSQTDDVKTALARAYHVPETNVTSSFVGPSWGEDVSRKALQGLIVFILLVAGVITLYFRTWKMAVAALIALAHDLIITLGVYALVGFEISPASVIGFLTILGYSLYDTVVVFDKVRENTEHITATTKRTYAEAANLAVNQTLVRSINTSVVALLPVASILFIGAFLLGAGTLKDIALALLVGIAAGTYSSIFIATPLLVDLREREPEIKAQAERVRRRRLEEAQREQRVSVSVGADAPDIPPAAATGDGPTTPDAAGADRTPTGASSGPAGAGARGGSGRGTGGSGGGSGGSGGGQRRQPRRTSRPRGKRR
jgi:preprotein translocase subunit SecF